MSAEAPASNLCAANGCTLGASVTANGKRCCFVHGAIREMADWDRATTRMRRQPGLLEAIARLRRGSSEIEIECGMAVVLYLLPKNAPLNRYACLQAAETALIAECTALESDGSSLADMMQPEQTFLTRSEKHDRAIENMRFLRDRKPGWFEIAKGLYRNAYGQEAELDDPADQLRAAVRATVAEADPVFASLAWEGR